MVVTIRLIIKNTHVVESITYNNLAVKRNTALSL